MNKVFLDTSYFKAFIDEKDKFHQKSLSIVLKLGKSGVQTITTNYILDESFTLLRVKGGIGLDKKLFYFLDHEGSEIEVVRVEAQDEQSVWDWFWQDWSKLSYTDCTSFAVMRRLGITQVATFDRHFEQAGFNVV